MSRLLVVWIGILALWASQAGFADSSKEGLLEKARSCRDAARGQSGIQGQSKFEEAVQYYQKALALYEREDGPESKGVCQICFELSDACSHIANRLSRSQSDAYLKRSRALSAKLGWQPDANCYSTHFRFASDTPAPPQPQVAQQVAQAVHRQQVINQGDVRVSSNSTYHSPGFRLAQDAYNAWVKSGKLHQVDDSAYLAKIAEIGGKVARASKRNLPWRFFVVADPTPNAFTYGEGFVGVTEGLLKLGLDDDELAGVLAHEVAHGALQQNVKHEVEKQQAQEELARSLLEVKQIDQLEPGVPARLQNKRRDLVEKIESLKKELDALESDQISQKNEYDADVEGMRYAVTAGFSAQGIAHALERLSLVASPATELAGQGSAHPPIAKRIELLNRVYQSWHP